jgi:AraC-like DNA-binding protein
MNNKTRTYEVISQVDSLRTLGIGVKHFPKYINLNSDNAHSLDIILMSFIVKGDVIHHLDSESYPESDLSISIINYGQQHSITTSEEGAEIINIYLDLKHEILPILPEQLQEVLPLFLPVDISMQNKLNRMIRLKFTEEDNAVAPLKEMEREINTAAPGFEAAVKDYLRLFLIKCARKVLHRNLKPAANINSHSLKKLERLRQFIDQNYKRQFQIAELARMSGFSPNYLCRIFKNYTGKTLTGYINERRIQAAMLLLKTTSKQIIEIASLAGFNDLSHFNHLFKKITESSPRKFREKAMLK